MTNDRRCAGGRCVDEVSVELMDAHGSNARLSLLGKNGIRAFPLLASVVIPQLRNQKRPIRNPVNDPVLIGNTSRPII